MTAPRACKDIPDGVFLAAVDEAIRLRSEDDERQWLWATRWDVAAVLASRPEDVGGSPVEYAEMPERLLLAKAKRLIERGLLDGCACGCRGDLSRPWVAAAVARSSEHLAPSESTVAASLGATGSRLADQSGSRSRRGAIS
jgi:hypothetical protein